MWVNGCLQLGHWSVANNSSAQSQWVSDVSFFLCGKGESHLCREVAGNNRSHRPCQGLIPRQIFGQRWDNPAATEWM